MTEDAQSERTELTKLLEKQSSEAESSPSAESERVRWIRAYFDALRGQAGIPPAPTRLDETRAAPEARELASALVDLLPADASVCEGLAATYQRLGLFESEVLSLALELRTATPTRRARIEERLVDLVRVEGREGVFRSLVAMAQGETKTALLLSLQECAATAGAVGQFVSLADERIASAAGVTDDSLHDLARAKARTLASDPSDQGQAAAVFKALIARFEREDDVRSFEAFVESRPSAEERQIERRWLYAWRAAHTDDPAGVLASWARAEEEYGEPEAAIAVYERILEHGPARKGALEALARLKLDAGDYEGALKPLCALREMSDDLEKRGTSLGIARLLMEELGRPLEAAEALAPLLAVSPPLVGAREMALRLIADAAIQRDVIERLERLANAGPAVFALRIFIFLASSQENTQTREERLRWLQGIVTLAAEDPLSALPALVKGTAEFPETLPLWDAAERVAKELGQTDVVSLAYYEAIASGAVGPPLAETLGRRMASYEGDCAADSSRVIDALQRVLELSPGALWALDRVKLVMGSQGRWSDLFQLYDRAIDASRTDGERAALLEEAAFAAKDLAIDPVRAIAYLELGHALAPENPSIQASLERLYERQGQTKKLIELFTRRSSTSSGYEQRHLRRRIGDLWLDLGSAHDAMEVVRQGIDDDEASLADMVQVLERIVSSLAPKAAGRGPSEEALLAAERALALLRGHYEKTGQIDDVVRLAEAGLLMSRDETARARGIRDLVDVCLRHAQTGADPFSEVQRRVEGHVAGSTSLAKIAYKMLLVRAISARKRHLSGTALKSARAVAWTAIVKLAELYGQADDSAGAQRLLYRGSRLPFEKGSRRELLARAALVASTRSEGHEHAIRLFDELFHADAGDPAAAESLAQYAKLLGEAGHHAKLAEVFEEQARLRRAWGHSGEEFAFWDRAAQLWEGYGAEERAVFAHGQGAALGKEASFEALARIHTERSRWVDATPALEWLYAHASPANRTARAMRLSEAFEAQGERARARACLEEALGRMDSDDTDVARQRLISLYRQDAVWAPLARLLASQAGRIDAAGDKVALLREAADVWRSRLGDSSRAALLLEEAIAHDPADGELRPALAEVLEELERWGDAAAVLSNQIDWYGQHRSKELAFTHQRRAKALIRAGKPGDALFELRAAADMVSGDASILRDLARVALDLDQLDLSESTYRVLLLALHQKAKSGDSSLSERASVFLDLGEIAARKGDSARATDLVDSAFEAADEQGGDFADLEAKLAARGRYDLLARTLDRRVSKAKTLAARVVALGRLASVWAERLGRSAELAARILEYAESVRRDIDREELSDAAAWLAVSTIHGTLGEEALPLGTRDHLAARLELFVTKTAPGLLRNELRLTLAKMLLWAPPRGDAAVAVLSSAYSDDPLLLDVTELLSDVLEQEGRMDELATVLRARLSSTDYVADSLEMARLSWRLGRALEATGRAPEALRVYQAVLESAPTDRDVLRELAARLGRLDSARLAECLELWMTVDTREAPAIATQLLAVHDRRGDVAGAVRALEVGFAANPLNDGVRNRLVRAHETRGQWHDAVRVLRRAAEARPKDRAILRRLTEGCRAAAEYQDGIRVLNAAIARSAHDGELLALRSTLHEAAGDDERARADLEAAFGADAKWATALIALLERIVLHGMSSAATEDPMLRLFDLLTNAGETVRARKHLAALLLRRPSHAGALTRAASLAASEGRWEDAAAAYRKLLAGTARENRDDFPRMAAALVDVCEQGGHIEQARDSIERAIEVLPDSPELARLLERICEASGDLRRLAELLVARANHENHGPEAGRLRMRAATLLLDASAPEDAASLIEQARTADPENAEIALLRARLFLAFGRPGDALDVLGEAVDLCHGKRTPLLGRVYLEIGRAHLAADELFEALEALDYGFAVDRRNDEAAMLLGLLAIDLGDEKTAERALSAITTMPSRRDTGDAGPDASTRAVAFYHLASLAYSKGDVGKARRLAGKAVGSGDATQSAARALLARLDVHGAAAG